MSTSVRVWSDSLDPAPGYRAELPVFGDDPDEQRSVLQAAVLCACAGAGLWCLLFGLIELVTP